MDYTHLEKTINKYIGGNVEAKANAALAGLQIVHGIFQSFSKGFDFEYINVSGNVEIGGNLKVATDAFYVDSTTKNVGFGTATPSYPIHISRAFTSGTTNYLFGADFTHSLGYSSGSILGYQYYNSTTISLNNGGLSGYLEMNSGSSNFVVGTGSTITLTLASKDIYYQLFTTAGNYIWKIDGGAELMRLTATGNLSVDTNVLYVDAANNRVGINTSSPAYPLDVIGVGRTSSSFLVGGDLTLFNGYTGATVPSNGFYRFNGQIAITSASNGTLKITNWEGNGFDRLQFGGTTSSEPALKKSGAALQAKLADDSDYTSFHAKTYYASGTSGFTGTGSYTNLTIEGGIITSAS